MKTILTSTAAALAALVLSNCAEPVGPNTQRGAATGALIGAGAGAIIGNQSGRPLEGALIGGAAGGAIGGTYGNARDADDRRYYNNGY